MNTWILDTALARLLPTSAVVLTEPPNSQMVGNSYLGIISGSPVIQDPATPGSERYCLFSTVENRRVCHDNGESMTSECQTDVSLEEDVLTFVKHHWPTPHRHKLTLETRIAQDLGMDGDDAVEFFEDFGKKFNVDFADLHIRWAQHFVPEGGGTLGTIVVVCLCVTAGFWLHDLFGLLPPWGWGIALIAAAILIYQRWIAGGTCRNFPSERLGHRRAALGSRPSGPRRTETVSIAGGHFVGEYAALRRSQRARS